MANPSVPTVFDRSRIRRNRERSAKTFPQSDFLHQRVLADIVDRLEVTNRTFPRALIYGAPDLEPMLTPACGVGSVYAAECAPSRLPAAEIRAVFDEDNQPLASGMFDLVVSMLTLHMANDPVGALIQYRQALKPDGLFLAAVLGNETLAPVRQAFLEAEASLCGGAASRFHPLADVRQWGNLLARSGMTLTVSDQDRVDVSYRRPDRVFKDLRAMGERFGLMGQPMPLREAVFRRAIDIMAESTMDVPFQVIYLTGWAPHPAQPKPLKPGSAARSMTTLFK